MIFWIIFKCGMLAMFPVGLIWFAWFLCKHGWGIDGTIAFSLTVFLSIVGEIIVVSMPWG